MKDYASKEKILASISVPTEDVEIAEGVWVRMKGLTAKDALDFYSKYMDAKTGEVKDLSGYSLELVSKCLVDEHGNSIYTPEEVGQFNTTILNKLLEVAGKLSGNDLGVSAKGKN
jgi:hypothetical protein